MITSNSEGWGMIELMISVSVLAIAVTSIFGLWEHSHRGARFAESYTQDVVALRRTLALFERDARAAAGAEQTAAGVLLVGAPEESRPVRWSFEEGQLLRDGKAMPGQRGCFEPPRWLVGDKDVQMTLTLAPRRVKTAAEHRSVSSRVAFRQGGQ